MQETLYNDRNIHEVFSNIKDIYSTLKKSSNELNLMEEEKLLSEIQSKINSNNCHGAAFNNQLQTLLDKLMRKQIMARFHNAVLYFNKYVFDESNYVKVDKEAFKSSTLTLIKMLDILSVSDILYDKDFEQYKEEFFMLVLKVIQGELLVNELESSVFDYIIKDEILSNNLSKIISEKLKRINASTFVENLSVLKELNEYVSRSSLIGTNNYLLDKRVIINLMFLEYKDINDRIKKSYEDLNKEMDSNICAINKGYGLYKVESKIIDFKRMKSELKSARKELKKKLIPLILTTSLFLGVGVTSNLGIKALSKETLYRTETTTYKKIGDEDIESIVVTSYAPKVKCNKTLSIFSSTYINYLVEERKNKRTFSLNSIENSDINEIFMLDENTLGLEKISDKSILSYEEYPREAFKQIDFINQDFEDSKEVFHDISYKVWSSIMWLSIFGISFIPYMPLNLLLKFCKFLKSDYIETYNSYKESAKVLDDYLSDAEELINKCNEIKNLYSEFQKYGFDLLLDEETHRKFEDNILNNKGLSNYEKLQKNAKKLKLEK